MKKNIFKLLVVLCAFLFCVNGYCEEIAEPSIGSEAVLTETEGEAVDTENDEEEQTEIAIPAEEEALEKESADEEDVLSNIGVVGNEDEEEAKEEPYGFENEAVTVFGMSLEIIVIIFAVLLVVILGLTIAVLVLTILKGGSDKNGDLINELNLKLANTAQAQEVRNLSDEMRDGFKRNERILRDSLDVSKELANKLSSIKSNMAAEPSRSSSSYSSPSGRPRRGGNVGNFSAAPKTTKEEYNNFLKSGAGFPSSLYTLKIDLGSLRVNQNDGMAFYAKDLSQDNYGQEAEIYPNENFLNEGYCVNLGDKLFSFKKSSDGQRKIVKPAKVKVVGPEKVLKIVDKGIAEY